MSLTRILIHIVFSTKNRSCTLHREKRSELYAYIGGIIRNLKCKQLALNGIRDHIHLLVDICPSISLSDFVKTVKQSSSIWLKGNPLFSDFDGWQEGYFAGSIGPDGIERCKNYILDQEKHHYGKSIEEEIEWLKLKYEIEEYRNSKLSSALRAEDC